MYKLTGLLIFLAFSWPGKAQQKNWQQGVDVVIHAKLNDATHEIDGNIAINYTNHSPDTLRYIWFHLWANAWKNDLTAYSDQLLQQNNTSFYFSDPADKGYINRLSFTVDGTLAAMENHPQHQDIVKLLLPKPLVPGQACKLFTPFHIQLPYNFGDGGHINQTYQVFQWYPQPALYNQDGWQETPFLRQGIPNSEFGNYTVYLTLPSNYKVAASGNWVAETLEVDANRLSYLAMDKGKKSGKSKMDDDVYVNSSEDLKTLHFKQNNIQQFVWLADKHWQINEDSIISTAGQKIAIKYFSEGEQDAIDNIAALKKALLDRTLWHGNFPYPSVCAVFARPGGIFNAHAANLIAIAEQPGDKAAISNTTDRLAGLIWFKAATGVNTLQEPWLAEGINSWYNKKLATTLPPVKFEGKEMPWHKLIRKRLPDDFAAFKLARQMAVRKDQPIAGTAQGFNVENYPLSVNEKTSNWLNWLAASWSEQKVHAIVKQYLDRGRFANADIQLFKKCITDAGVQQPDVVFSKLYGTGPLADSPVQKKIKLYPLFNFKKDSRYNYLYIAPAVGYNYYDKLMLGGLLHNFDLPERPFQFLAAPMYGTATKQLNLLARAGYSWFSNKQGGKLTVSLAATNFTIDEFTDSTGKKNYMRFSKLVPTIRYESANKNMLSRKRAWVQWKTFLIREQGLLFTRDTVEQKDIITYPWSSRYLNQLQAGMENNRALYPWKAVFQAEQGDQFIRLAFTGNYFFNYAKGGGLDVRVFAGKFFYTTARTFLNQALTSAYHLNLTGPKGNEDYTYSNYFYGRSEFQGLAAQQIMQRDGFFKVRTDLLSSKIGQTDNWLFAANFASSIPGKYNPLEVLPIKIPVKIFADIGTYADAWSKNSGQPRFVFDAGVQLSLFKNVLNVYVPLLYSGVYRDYFKQLSAEDTFFKRISFSIDIHHLSVKHFIPQVSL